MINTIIHGDCYKVLPTLPDGSIDLVVTDPPYDLPHYFSNKTRPLLPCQVRMVRSLDRLGNLDCMHFTPEPFLDMLLPKMRKVNLFVFCNKALVIRYLNYAESHKLHYDILVLAKTNLFPVVSNSFIRDIDYIIQMRESGATFVSGLPTSNYLKFFECINNKSYHPAEKPVDFLARFIRVCSLPGHLVLDPFAGSGSTLVAAKKLGRKYLGIEKSEKYVKIAQARLAQEVSLYAPVEKSTQLCF